MHVNQVLKGIHKHCIRKGLGGIPHIPRCAKEYGEPWLDLTGFEDFMSKISQSGEILGVIGASSSQEERKLREVVCWKGRHQPKSFNFQSRAHLNVSLKQQTSENLGGRNLSCLCPFNVFRTYENNMTKANVASVRLLLLT